MMRATPFQYREDNLQKSFAQLAHAGIRIRAGTAPIEFLMFIPVIVGFTAAMIWLVRVQNDAIQVGLNAEIMAAEKAVSLSQKSELGNSDTLGKISAAKEFQQLIDSFQPGLRATHGTIHAKTTLNTGKGVANLIQPAGDVQDEHWTLAHSFEAEVFAFPQSSSQQPELTFPSSIRGIAPEIKNLGRFLHLLQFSGDSHSLTLTNVQMLSHDVDSSREFLENALRDVRTEIDESESRIRQLQSQPEPDWAAVEKLLGELDQLHRQEQELLVGLEYADRIPER